MSRGAGIFFDKRRFVAALPLARVGSIAVD